MAHAHARQRPVTLHIYSLQFQVLSGEYMPDTILPSHTCIFFPQVQHSGSVGIFNLKSPIRKVRQLAELKSREVGIAQVVALSFLSPIQFYSSLQLIAHKVHTMAQATPSGCNCIYLCSIALCSTQRVKGCAHSPKLLV